MIDVQQVRELIQLMVEHDLSEIRVREGETSISLRKGPFGPVQVSGGYVPPAVATTVPPPSAEPARPGDQALANEGFIPITSPMVGTFYAAPDPDSPAYVNVGSDVTPDTPICIIEAMKVFNQIKAEVSGVIERILVQDQQAVEFGQPLMLVRPRS